MEASISIKPYNNSYSFASMNSSIYKPISLMRIPKPLIGSRFCSKTKLTLPYRSSLPSAYSSNAVNGGERERSSVVADMKEISLGLPSKFHFIGEDLFQDCRLSVPQVNNSQYAAEARLIIKNENLQELRKLGSGTFGNVYHGEWNGADVAIKRFKQNNFFNGRLSEEQKRLVGEFWREADILCELRHPNIVAFYGVVVDGPGDTMATVTEFMVNGSLRDVLVHQDRDLDRRKKLILAADAAVGMEYLHSKNIIHFDLKCDNLLVNLKDPLRPICKVGDFGLSKEKMTTLVTGGLRGTLSWIAPELWKGCKVSEKVDVYSFGIVLWEILTGEIPYPYMAMHEICVGVVSNSLRPSIPSFCDFEWRNLMEECWAADPVARPSFAEIARRLRVMSADGVTSRS